MKLLKTILISAFLLATLLINCPTAFSESGSGPLLSNEKMATLIGRIDRISTTKVTINDRRYKISEEVSIDGFKKGDFVKFVTTKKRVLLKIRHADLTKKKSRE